MMYGGKPVDAVIPAEVDDREYKKVTAWRTTYLIRAGYDDISAALIAESKADLHRAADLLTRGCNITTALLILL